MEGRIAEIRRADNEVALAHFGFENEAEFLVSGKGVDDLHDGLGFQGNLVEHHGAGRGCKDAPPLPIGVVGRGEVREGRVLVVDEETHGSGLVGEVDGTPEAGEECGVLPLPDRFPRRRVKDAATLCQGRFRCGERSGHEHVVRFGRSLRRNDPDLP